MTPITPTTHVTADPAAWARTPVGDPAQWPESLRTAADMCLAYPTSCCLLWGDRSYFFYNESMARSIGVRHPTGMGHPLYDVLPHVWRTVGPLLHEVVRTGKAFTATRFPIHADVGDGVVAYFIDFTFVPVRDGDRVLGVFAPVGNNTVTHLDSQHHQTIAAIATVPADLPRDATIAQVARHLVASDDIRFAAVFLRDPQTHVLERVAVGGAALRSASTLAALDVAVARGRWPLEQILGERCPPARAAVGKVRPGGNRPLWEDAWLVAFPAPTDGVLVLGLDERIVGSEPPAHLVARLAAAAGERISR